MAGFESDGGSFMCLSSVMCLVVWGFCLLLLDRT